MACELFVVGSMAFYGLLVAFALLAFWVTEYDRYEGGTLAVAALFLGSWLLFGDLGTLAMSNLLGLAWKVPAYLCVGLAWSFPKWVLWLRKALRKYQEVKAAYECGDKRTPLCDSYEFARLRHEYGMEITNGKLEPPAFADNRQRMVNWVLLWPFSVLWTFARDGVYKVVDLAVGCFGKLHQRLSDWVFKGIE